MRLQACADGERQGRDRLRYRGKPARRGHATRAVAAMLEAARRDGVRVVLAETIVDNIASQRVLERNGFERFGTRRDPRMAS